MFEVHNRLRRVKCEVETRSVDAALNETGRVVPGDLNLNNERHATDIVLYRRHDGEFQKRGLIGVVSAYDDTIMEAEP